jgi:dynein heavy chain
MDLLGDDNLIDILANSKEVSSKIEEENKISAEAEKIIDQTREDFRSVAFRSSILYFCITDLDKIDPMY